MIDVLWLALRAAGLIFSFEAAGMALFVASFAPGLERATALRLRARRIALAALAVLAAQALIEPAHMAGEWAGAGDEALWRLSFTSPAGVSNLVRFAGLVLLAFGLATARPRTLAPALGGSVAVVVAPLLSGHTAVHPERVLLAPLLFVHLSVLAFWFGSLRPLRALTVCESPLVAARVLQGFSRTAVWLVPLIGLAGAAMAVLLLPGPAALLEPYGALLLAKVLLFALLLGLAALNRLRLVPALARGQGEAALRLRRSIALEYLLMCTAFAVTAVMTGMFAPSGVA